MLPNSAGHASGIQWIWWLVHHIFHCNHAATHRQRLCQGVNVGGRAAGVDVRVGPPEQRVAAPGRPMQPPGPPGRAGDGWERCEQRGRPCCHLLIAARLHGPGMLACGAHEPSARGHMHAHDLLPCCPVCSTHSTCQLVLYHARHSGCIGLIQQIKAGNLHHALHTCDPQHRAAGVLSPGRWQPCCHMLLSSPAGLPTAVAVDPLGASGVGLLTWAPPAGSLHGRSHWRGHRCSRCCGQVVRLELEET